MITIPVMISVVRLIVVTLAISLVIFIMGEMFGVFREGVLCIKVLVA